MIVRRFVGCLALYASLSSLTVPALADQQYVVDGRDSFQILGRDVRSEIAYSGTQQLRMVRNASGIRYTAVVDYDRIESGIRAHMHGSFESTVLRNGEQVDGRVHDPDYLTVLNQPFSVVLDPETMHDLRGLQGEVPFDFPSPMTGATLHGSLRRLPDAKIRGERVLGIAFRARGPLHGNLPDHPTMTLAGAITMNGTAYYTYASALLLALDATLAIGGNVDESARHDPVAIIYKRVIRPLGAELPRPATGKIQ